MVLCYLVRQIPILTLTLLFAGINLNECGAAGMNNALTALLG